MLEWEKDLEFQAILIQLNFPTTDILADYAKKRGVASGGDFLEVLDYVAKRRKEKRNFEGEI